MKTTKQVIKRFTRAGMRFLLVLVCLFYASGLMGATYVGTSATPPTQSLSFNYSPEV